MFVKISSFVALVVQSLLLVRGHDEKKNPQYPVVVFAFSGLRWDSLKSFRMPALHKLSRDGVYGRRKIDAFQTATLPSFVTMFTGLYPEHHGIISNKMKDLNTGENFDVSSRGAKWWGNLCPIWVHNEKRGGFSALCYIPGHNVLFNGTKATYGCNGEEFVDPFVELNTRGEISGKTMSFAERVNRVKEWLSMKRNRPQFIAVYFEEPIRTVSKYGCTSEEMESTMMSIDNITRNFVEYLKDKKLYERVNFIVTGESGFTTSKHKIFLEDFNVDESHYTVIDEAPIMSVFPKDKKAEQKLIKAWSDKHMKIYPASRLPPSFHFYYANRTAPLVFVADENWRIFRYRRVVDTRKAVAGYDGKFQSTHALFLGHGPSLNNVRLDAMGNVDVFGVLRRLLGIEGDDNDGNITNIRRTYKHQGNWLSHLTTNITASSTGLTVTVIVAILMLFVVIYVIIVVLFKTSHCLRLKRHKVEHRLLSDDESEDDMCQVKFKRDE